MIEIIAIGMGAGLLNGINKVIAAQKKHDKQTAVCNSCKAEAPLGSKFCPNCRKTEFTRKKEFKKAELQKKIATNKQAHQSAERDKRLEEAKTYLIFVQSARVCNQCNIGFSADAKFCTNCGSATFGASSETVLEWMRSGFPDVVRSDSDIEMLEKFSRQGKVTAGSVILKGSKAVVKGTLWAGTKVGQSILDEMSKK